MIKLLDKTLNDDRRLLCCSKEMMKRNAVQCSNINDNFISVTTGGDAKKRQCVSVLQ